MTRIDHAEQDGGAAPGRRAGSPTDYDIIVVTAGAVTRKFPIPGIAEQAIGLKHVEEAVAIRDRLLVAFDQAATLPPGPERTRLLTVTVVGGGFTGVEGFGELLSLATSLLDRYPELSFDDLTSTWSRPASRILPEVSDGPGAWVVDRCAGAGPACTWTPRSPRPRTDTSSCPTGEEFDSELIIWTAGNAANPVVRQPHRPAGRRAEA